MGLLREIFGPSKGEIWSQLANDIGGQYEKGGILGTDALRYRAGQWEITLDTFIVSTGKSSATYTRMRAPFINKDGLYFKIYRECLFSAIGKMFGMQDIEIGNRDFDNGFIVKGNNADKVRLLLHDTQLILLMQQQPGICFGVKNDDGWFGSQFPRGVDELYFQCYGIIKDEARLKSLFEMFSITLQRLVQIDSAYDNDPNIRL